MTSAPSKESAVEKAKVQSDQETEAARESMNRTSDAQIKDNYFVYMANSEAVGQKHVDSDDCVC